MVSKLFNNENLMSLRRTNDFLIGTLFCLIFLGVIGLELSYSKFSTKYKSLSLELPIFSTQPFVPLYPKDLTEQID